MVSVTARGTMAATRRPLLVMYVTRPWMASLITSARCSRTSRVVRSTASLSIPPVYSRCQSCTLVYMHPYYEALVTAGLMALPADGGDMRDENGCLLWSDGKSGAGYGVVYRQPQKPEYVHRVSHEAAIGPIPDGYHVDHVWERGCRSRACFWPGHLEAVTEAENQRRRGLAYRASTERPCGHGWDDNRPGRSDCASCHREHERARKSANGPSKGAQRAALIRSLAAAGRTNAEIVEEVGCSRQTVSRVIRGIVHADAA